MSQSVVVRRPKPGRASSSLRARHIVLRVLLVVLPAVANAQVTSTPPVVPPVASPADSIPPFARPNGTLLRQGTLTYRMQLIRSNGQATSLGMRTVVVSETSVAGVPSWLILETRSGTVVPTLDSVIVARADMSPERWAATIGSAQMAASFTADSVFGVLQTYQGRSSFVLGVPANVLLSAAHAERLLEMLPLREGYRANAAMLVVGGALPTILPAELRVERDEDVVVNGRRMPAWRVVLRSGAIEARYWVSRDGTRVVRTEQALPDGVMVGTLVP